MFRCCDIFDVVHIWDYMYHISVLLFMRAIHTVLLLTFSSSVLFHFVLSIHVCVCSVHVWVCCDAAIMYLQKTIRIDNKNEYTSWLLVACVSISPYVCVCVGGAGRHVASGDDISISSILHKDLFLFGYLFGSSSFFLLCLY